MLEDIIKARRAEKGILLMTHIVLGYPDYDTSLRTVETMVEAGVDLMELQIPFSEPMADGPVILKANADALSHGARVERSLKMAEDLCSRFEIPFVFMTYYNILFKYGVHRFAEEMHRIGIKGAIIPDLPPEEGAQYLKSMNQFGLCPIHIFTPNSSPERLRFLAENSSGFVYAVARKGVTGKDTDFSGELDDYLGACRAATDLPIALGFGVKDKRDIDFLRGKVDIAVIGSETIRVLNSQGVEGVKSFIEEVIG